MFCIYEPKQLISAFVFNTQTAQSLVFLIRNVKSLTMLCGFTVSCSVAVLGPGRKSRKHVFLWRCSITLSRGAMWSFSFLSNEICINVAKHDLVHNAEILCHFVGYMHVLRASGKIGLANRATLVK